MFCSFTCILVLCFINIIILELCVIKFYEILADFKIPGCTLERRFAGRTLKVLTIP